MNDGSSGSRRRASFGRPWARNRPRRAFLVTTLEALEGRRLLSSSGDHAAAMAARPLIQPVSQQMDVPAAAGAHHARVASRGPIDATKGQGGDPAFVGSWTPPTMFRPPHAKGAYVAIHMTVLPNGEVLTWPHNYNYFLATNHAAPSTPNLLLWDPTTNQYQHMNLPQSNIFCSGSTWLPDGRLMVLGGHGKAAIPVAGAQTAYGNNHVMIYDYRTNTWTKGPDMSTGRYYGSAITLGTGQVLVVAGYNEDGWNASQVELYTDGQGFRVLPGANTAAYPDWYPHIYQLSNGLVFGANPGAHTFFINPTGNGQLWAGPPMNYSRRYYGASVMYDDNQIIAIGGNAATFRGSIGKNDLITNTAETINLNDPNPTWQYTSSMKYPRYYPNATLLPDGTVLVTGGTSQQNNPNGNALAGAVYAAELWNPKTGQWTTMSSMSVPRLYHSTAILLPDGRVLVAGGGEPESTGEAKGTTHQNMQIFSPPYLFRGPQPVISSAPSTAQYGQTITVTSPDAASITAINLIRPGTTTHGFNMTQRIVHASFTRAADGSLQVQMPTNPNLAPPGPYMLFLLNSQGVPSKAAMFFLQGNPASAAAATSAPQTQSGSGNSWS
jgi:hypothetical protein